MTQNELVIDNNNNNNIKATTSELEPPPKIQTFTQQPTKPHPPVVQNSQSFNEPILQSASIQIFNPDNYTLPIKKSNTTTASTFSNSNSISLPNPTIQTASSFQANNNNGYDSIKKHVEIIETSSRISVNNDHIDNNKHIEHIHINQNNDIIKTNEASADDNQNTNTITQEVNNNNNNNTEVEAKPVETVAPDTPTALSTTPSSNSDTISAAVALTTESNLSISEPDPNPPNTTEIKCVDLEVTEPASLNEPAAAELNTTTTLTACDNDDDAQNAKEESVQEPAVTSITNNETINTTINLNDDVNDTIIITKESSETSTVTLTNDNRATIETTTQSSVQHKEISGSQEKLTSESSSSHQVVTESVENLNRLAPAEFSDNKASAQEMVVETSEF